MYSTDLKYWIGNATLLEYIISKTAGIMLRPDDHFHQHHLQLKTITRLKVFHTLR